MFTVCFCQFFYLRIYIYKISVQQRLYPFISTVSTYININCINLYKRLYPVYQRLYIKIYNVFPAYIIYYIFFYRAFRFRVQGANERKCQRFMQKNAFSLRTVNHFLKAVTFKKSFCAGAVKRMNAQGCGGIAQGCGGICCAGEGSTCAEDVSGCAGKGSVCAAERAAD